MKILQNQTFWLGVMTACSISFIILFIGMATDKVAFGDDVVATTTNTPIPAAAQEPEPQPQAEISISDVTAADHIKGAEKAKVTIVEYSSFSCGYCKTARPILNEVLAAYPDDVRLVYRHFDRGGTDAKSAQASECAGEQGKFWEMHDLIFDKGANSYAEYATELGIDPAKLTACTDSDKYLDKVRANTTEARNSGIDGTPAFVLNGEALISGRQPASSFKQVIDQMLAN